MIFSAYYYQQDPSQGPILSGENFSPGKHFEMFPLWYQYLRRLYPHEDIVLLSDGLSKVPLPQALPFITEPYEIMSDHRIRGDVKFHVKNIAGHPGEQGRPDDAVNPIRWALFEAVACAYLNNRDMLWVDCDCLLNTDVYPLVGDGDVFTINQHHGGITMDTYFFYISARRLHALDEIVFLPSYHFRVLSMRDGDSRMRLGQEWGFYQLFYYGETRHSHNLNVTHRSCLPSMIKFLKRNPLPTIEHHRFLGQCLAYEINSSFWRADITIDFPDVYYEQTV